MSEAETKTIVGQCVEIIDKPENDWVRFNIDIGTNYPVGLSTKKDSIIEAARAVGGDIATWTYQESDGNPNPNRPGTYYKNRYLDKVEVGDRTAEQIAGDEAHSPGSDSARTASGTGPVQTTLPVETTSEPVDWDAKERRDYRSRTWAITVSAFTHTIKPDEDPAEVFKRLIPFQTRLYHDVVRELGIADDQDIPF